MSSTDKRELLGEFLIGRGQVLRMEVEMALSCHGPLTYGGRLGDALVGIGALRPIELFRAVHDQTEERLVELFEWRTGEIAFAQGVRSQEETFPLGTDTYDLIGRRPPGVLRRRHRGLPRAAPRGGARARGGPAGAARDVPPPGA